MSLLANLKSIRTGALSRLTNSDLKMKVLLTGGSGFVAVHCLDELLKKG
jgi:hypothetical protein